MLHQKLQKGRVIPADRIRSRRLWLDCGIVGTCNWWLLDRTVWDELSWQVDESVDGHHRSISICYNHT